MQFDSFSAFISMGKYGFYVWLSYGVALLLLSLLVYSSVTGHKKIIKEIALRQQRDHKLRQAREQRNDKQRNSKNAQ